MKNKLIKRGLCKTINLSKLPFRKSFSNWLCSKKGNAIALSLSLTSFLVLVSIGASNIILSSSKSSKNVEKYNNAFLVAESGIESAMYEISFHSAGYEVSNNKEDTDHSRINLNTISKSESWWSTESRSSMSDDTSSDISIPNVGDGNSDSSGDWNQASFGQTKSIQLYADNTSCSDLSGKDCGDAAAATGGTCTVNSYTNCVLDDLHWFDSCDVDEGSYGCTASTCSNGYDGTCCSDAVCSDPAAGTITGLLGGCTGGTPYTITCASGSCDATTNLCN